MSMPAFARRIIELEKKVEIFEAYRYSRIGSVVDVTARICRWKTACGPTAPSRFLTSGPS